MISVFSMTDVSTGIWEKGLKYTLDDAALKNDKALGVSNEFIGEESSISVQEGTLLVMWEEHNGLPVQREILKKTASSESAKKKNETLGETEVELSVQNAHGEEE